MEDKKRAAEEKARAKAEAAARARAAEAARRAEASIPPTEFFRGQTDKYSAWDAQGIPTTAADGKPLADKARRKAEAAWAEQDKKHKWFLSLPPAAAEGGAGTS